MVQQTRKSLATHGMQICFPKCDNGMGCVPNGGLKDTCIIVFVEVQIFSNPTVVQPTKEEC
jgi:hypothetical protein